MDIGYWIRSFQIHYLRAKGLSGNIISWTMLLDYSQVIYWNYLRIWTLIPSWRWSHILFQVDVISTGRYYDDVDITNGTLIVTYKSCQQDGSFVRCSIANVCIYSGTRFAPIHVPNYACSVCITIFFLWQMCVMLYSITCHVVYCNMLLYAIVCML